MGKGIESLCCCVAARGTSGNTSHGQHCNSSARLQLRAGGASGAVQGESPAGLAQASLHDGSDSHHSCPQSHGNAVPCTLRFAFQQLGRKSTDPLYLQRDGAARVLQEKTAITKEKLLSLAVGSLHAAFPSLRKMSKPIQLTKPTARAARMSCQSPYPWQAWQVFPSEAREYGTWRSPFGGRIPP